MNKVFAIAGAIALSIIPTPTFSGEVEQLEQKIEKLCGTDSRCLQMMSREIEMMCGTGQMLTDDVQRREWRACLQIILKGKEQMLNERRRIEMLCGTDSSCRIREARKRHCQMLGREWGVDCR